MALAHVGVTGKFEVEVHIKSCSDLFHELWSQKPHEIAKITPSNIHGCEVHEGEFGKPGSIINWNYTVGGKQCVAKEIIEEIDEEKKYIRFRVIEGDLIEKYKHFTISIQVIPKGEMSEVKWIIEFEKKFADDGHYPTEILDLAIIATKDIEAHHLNA